MSDVKLDWARAEVEDGKLTVPIEGEVPDGWKDSFERTVKLLGDREWGTAKLKKDAVRVADITPGTEEKLHHHLEAIVAQANAALEREESEHASGDGSERARQGPDAEMTARFRAFSTAEEDAS